MLFFQRYYIYCNDQSSKACSSNTCDFKSPWNWRKTWAILMRCPITNCFSLVYFLFYHCYNLYICPIISIDIFDINHAIWQNRWAWTSSAYGCDWIYNSYAWWRSQRCSVHCYKMIHALLRLILLRISLIWYHLMELQVLRKPDKKLPHNFCKLWLHTRQKILDHFSFAGGQGFQFSAYQKQKKNRIVSLQLILLFIPFFI